MSSTPTLVDQNAMTKAAGHDHIPLSETISNRDSGKLEAQGVAGTVHPLAALSNGRKNVLLIIFAVASFVDVCNVSGVAIAVAQISSDIDLGISQIVWIITRQVILTHHYFPDRRANKSQQL